MPDWPISFSLKDVRCFRDFQEGSLRPITLLVGENSTGKSTFLGCYSVIHRLFSAPNFSFDEPDFNIMPFLMGSFRDIVRAQRGPAGRLDQFQLGLSFNGATNVTKRVSVSFSETGSEPTVSSVRYTIADSFLDYRRTPTNEICILTPEHKTTIDYSFDLFDRVTPLLKYQPEYRQSMQLQQVTQYIEAFGKRWFDWKPVSGKRYAKNLSGFVPTTITSVAPLRAQPLRTYNPIREAAVSDGKHVPMLMMRLDRSDKREWTKLHKQLVSFGSNSGLFTDIKVKGHGKNLSDPFQLQVKANSGAHANIMDVGYGVSQSLPILVDVMSASEEMFILQQPEVHLHPRGQAELATFFVDSACSHGNRFLIETHSDYIIDRVRIDVRQGRLPAEDVSILYFESSGSAVRVHELTLDDQGNLRDVPEGYRHFFAKETDRLLGFEN